MANAAALDHAIDSLRQAPNSQKAKLLTELQKLRCEEPPLCELKKLCEAGYARHVAALHAIAEVKRRLHDGAVPSTLARELERSRKELLAAERQAQDCVARQGRIRERYLEP